MRTISQRELKEILDNCQQYRIEYLSTIKMFENMREAYLKKCNGGGKSSERNIE